MKYYKIMQKEKKETGMTEMKSTDDFALWKYGKDIK